MLRSRSLDRVDIFRYLSKADRAAIAGQCSWQKFRSGQAIIEHNDQSLDVYFLVEGAARVIIYSFSGKPSIFRHVRPGEIFGELAAVDQRPRTATVEATADCVTASLCPGAFWQALIAHPAATRHTLQWLSAQIRGLTGRVLEFSTLAVRNRVHAELLRLGRDSIRQDGSAAISPIPTHAELASRISTHREAVAREMSHLMRSGVIERQGNLLVICNLQELTRLVEEVLGESLLNLDSND